MLGVWVQVDIPEKVLSQSLKNQLVSTPAFSLSVIPVQCTFSFMKRKQWVSSVIPDTAGIISGVCAPAPSLCGLSEHHSYYTRIPSTVS